jgi:hypothetical protein
MASPPGPGKLNNGFVNAKLRGVGSGRPGVAQSGGYGCGNEKARSEPRTCSTEPRTIGLARPPERKRRDLRGQLH